LIELSAQTIVMSQYLRIYVGVNTTCHLSVPPFGPIVPVADNVMSAWLMIVCIFNGPHLTRQLVYCIYMVQAIGVSRVLRFYKEVSGSALPSPVVPPQVLPVWPVGCPSPDGLRLLHGFAFVSLKNSLATLPVVFQTSERWVSLLLHFSMTSMDGLGFSK
jgi:hypothetical protein